METINDNGLKFIRSDFNHANAHYDANFNDFQTIALNLSRKYTPEQSIIFYSTAEKTLHRKPFLIISISQFFKKNVQIRVS